jgi:hypothetical protein
MKRRDLELEQNQTKTDIIVFLEAYNKSVPQNFPRASAKALRAFQTSNPSLFKAGDEWSIELHRKKFMDWLPTYHA